MSDVKKGFIAATAVLAFLALLYANRATSVTGAGVIEQDRVHLSFPAIEPEPVPLGRIKLFVEEGARVRQGQKLAIIDSDIYRLAVARDKAAAKGARERLTIAEDNLAQIAENKSQLSADVSATKEALAQLDDKKRSVQDKLAHIGPEDSAAKKKKLTGELTKLKSESAKLNSKLEAITQSGGAFAGTESRLEKAKQSAELQNNLAKQAVVGSVFRQKQTVLRAPRAGRILNLAAATGELVYPNQTVIDLGGNRFDLKLYLDTTTAARIRPDMYAQVFIDAYPRDPLEASVERLVPEIEPAPSNLATGMIRLFDVQAVILSVEDRNGILKAGLPADAVIDY
jgi:multidrug resistance efflux pump